MTVEDVKARLAYFETRGGRAPSWWDDEDAHGQEDDLWHDVLEAIAEGKAEDPIAMARLALTTAAYDFSRWYA